MLLPRRVAALVAAPRRLPSPGCLTTLRAHARTLSRRVPIEEDEQSPDGPEEVGEHFGGWGAGGGVPSRAPSLLRLPAALERALEVETLPWLRRLDTRAPARSSATAVAVAAADATSTVDADADATVDAAADATAASAPTLPPTAQQISEDEIASVHEFAAGRLDEAYAAAYRTLHEALSNPRPLPPPVPPPLHAPLPPSLPPSLPSPLPSRLYPSRLLPPLLPRSSLMCSPRCPRVSCGRSSRSSRDSENCAP